MKLKDIDIYGLDHYEQAGPPHEQLDFLRKHDPLHWQEIPGERGYWVVTKYEDLGMMSRDPKRFSSHEGGGTIIEDYEGNDLSIARNLMVNMDPPSHPKFRKLVSRGFTPRMTAHLEPKVEAIAKRLVDAVAESGECDFVESLAVPLPLEMIAELLGAAEEDRPKLLGWTNRLLGFSDPELGSRADMSVATMELAQWSHKLAASRKGKDTGEDLATILTNGSVDGDALNNMEFAMFVLLLSVAGNETTRNLFSQGTILLMENPKAVEEIRADWSLLPNAIEEMLRMASPLTYMRRTAMEDVELRGKTIKKGDKIALCYASANRDEEKFEDPHTFNIHRKNAGEHVAFGIGQHFCLGANLAKLEIRILYKELLARLPDMKPNGNVRRLRSNYINGIKEMPIRFTPEARVSAAE
jgi:cholest-4-en-3-one 26-monooxygenase